MNNLMKVDKMAKVLEEYSNGISTSLDSRLISPVFKSGYMVRTLTDDGEPTGGIPFKITTVMVVNKNPKIKDKIWWKSPVGWYRQTNLERVKKWYEV